MNDSVKLTMMDVQLSEVVTKLIKAKEHFATDMETYQELGRLTDEVTKLLEKNAAKLSVAE